MNIQLTLCLLAAVLVASVSVEGSAIVGALRRGARQVDMSRFKYWNMDGDVDDHFVFEEDQPRVISTTTTTTTTMRPTTVAVPGMGTARTPCEDACQTTNQYNPVCGDDNVTYYNHARLACATRCGKRVQMSRLGRCSVWDD